MNVKLYITLIIVLVSFCQSNGQHLNARLSVNSFRNYSGNEEQEAAIGSYNLGVGFRSYNFNLIAEHISKSFIKSFSYYRIGNTNARITELSDFETSRRDTIVSGSSEHKFVISVGYQDTIGSKKQFLIKAFAGINYGIRNYTPTQYNTAYYNSDNTVYRTIETTYKRPNTFIYGIHQEVSINKFLFNKRVCVGLALRNFCLYDRTKGEFTRTEVEHVIPGNEITDTRDVKVDEKYFNAVNLNYGLQLVYNIYNLK